MNTKTNPAAPVDSEQLVQRCNGKVQLAMRMLEMFREDVVRQFSDIRNAVDQNDLEALARAAHAMKGTASMVSANETSQLAAEIEVAAKGSDLEQARATLESLSQQVELCARYKFSN
ncbi:MAG: Hpt domain-containing protein [Planctomycetota bacterium]